jgi:adenosylhomocysteinase
MDMSFANQFLALKRLAETGAELENKVYDLPEEQDLELASLKLETLGVEIDDLTEEQLKYLSDYSSGT